MWVVHSEVLPKQQEIGLFSKVECCVILKLFKQRPHGYVSMNRRLKLQVGSYEFEIAAWFST